MLSPAQMDSLLKEDKGEYVLVDIKERREFNEVHILLAINIPVHIVASISYGLPKKVVYCNKESRIIERTGN